MKRNKRITRPLHLLLGLLGLWISSACAAIQVRTEWQEEAHIGLIDTYAWIDLETGTAISGPDLRESVKTTVDSHLEGIGWHRTDPRNADVWVTYETDVEVRERAQDPYWEYYAGERYELGTLRLELLRPRTLDSLWRGEGTSELRLVAVQRSLLTSDLDPVERPREWKVPEKVAAILEPLADDSAD